MRLAFSEEAQKGFVRRAEAADSSKPYITLVADDWRPQLYTPNRICVLRVLTYLTKEPETIAWMDGMPGDAVMSMSAPISASIRSGPRQCAACGS